MPCTEPQSTRTSPELQSYITNRHGPAVRRRTEGTPDCSSDRDHHPVRASSTHSTEGSDRLKACRNSATSYRDDAVLAVKALGTSADMRVKSGTWMHIGEWLDWPDWLCDGTSLGCGPLPTHISAADDILIAANILEHADIADVLTRLL